MINDIQIITKNAKTTEDSTVVVNVGAGKAGQPFIFLAQSGVREERRETVKNVAPDQLLFKRKGNDLLILLNAEGHASDKEQPADIIIENYYGERNAHLIGIDEEKKNKTYLTQEGTVDLLSWNVADGASTYQSLGELHEQAAWLPFLLGGLAVVGAAAGAGGGGSDDPKPINNSPVATDDTASGTLGNPVVVDVVKNDSDANSNLDPSTVQIVGGTNGGKTLVVAGEGTWTVNPTTVSIFFLL